MHFSYDAEFGAYTPEAYERLLLDVMAGDATLFMRRDAVEAAWEFVTPILDHWAESRARFLPEYRAGTWGPLEADQLIEALEALQFDDVAGLLLCAAEAERGAWPCRGAGEVLGDVIEELAIAVGIDSWSSATSGASGKPSSAIDHQTVYAFSASPSTLQRTRSQRPSNLVPTYQEK